MVVDDEVSVGNFVGEVLRDAGYEVLVFNESPRRAAPPAGATTRHFPADHRSEHAADERPELAEQAKALNPALPVVLITGFVHSHQASSGRARPRRLSRQAVSHRRAAGPGGFPHPPGEASISNRSVPAG
jgi:CheY-like chemotaxis protein